MNDAHTWSIGPYAGHKADIFHPDEVHLTDDGGIIWRPSPEHDDEDTERIATEPLRLTSGQGVKLWCSAAYSKYKYPDEPLVQDAYPNVDFAYAIDGVPQWAHRAEVLSHVFWAARDPAGVPGEIRALLAERNYPEAYALSRAYAVLNEEEGRALLRSAVAQHAGYLQQRFSVRPLEGGALEQRVDAHIALDAACQALAGAPGAQFERDAWRYIHGTRSAMAWARLHHTLLRGRGPEDAIEGFARLIHNRRLRGPRGSGE